MENNTQNQPTISTPDYANMTEQERMDAAMKQAGMAPGDIGKMVAKNMATNMAKSTAKNWIRTLLRSIFKF
ncbi:MAG: hypothetical protein ACD_18C00341G0003 [uncultured bacterium]|nr:MAG: hypothetical protein ACD_18C00341G0003 [uncultured bacterium]OGH84211.1 MAG: hypothetical protein A2488_02445 [Candidatus Magasanikbacteria bacterium RIFOXYC12_FULL_32_21b]OGH90206.1 MAG: hypothetical protein A2507_03990 [Candidatus Magasanikbacteria bacterium RIFOXYD12_FULL_33_17]HAO52200.1 hypothetical protein [Candidatus Magasanikbacteria bacterium]